MKIDAHQHFWALSRGDYGWLTPELAEIYRDFLPSDLEPLLLGAGIEGTILVQAAPTSEETEFMLGLAHQHAFIKGVVGWTDFDSPAAAAEITRLARNPALVGLRPMIQSIPDKDWMLKDELTPVYRSIVGNNLTFDALTLPVHLRNLGELMQRHPDMRVVINHGSKPCIRDGSLAEWAEDIAVIAKETNAFCKFSGLITEAAEGWTDADLRPYADVLLNSFGPDRLIWGSDWPVCTLAGAYERWVETSDNLLADCSTAERDAVLGGNAARAYRLGA